jgi:glutamate-1-semialdehyde 2,1-aminomutase
VTATTSRAATTRSAELFEQARRVIPGGVNSPVRAFRAVGGTPRFIAAGRGAHIVDADGTEYVDYICSWGALALGHAHPTVVDAIARQASRGTSFGAPTELETALAERITAAMPSIEMVRFVSSGTEATMSALRLARGATGRSMIVKFAGCYHGHADALLVRAGSGVATLSLPDAAGVTASAVAGTLVAEYNDLVSVERLFAEHGHEIAAVIVEPVAGNMGLVLPEPGFLEGLRAIATRAGALLIFDEVMTGFRVARGGAQGIYDVQPDLTCLGKVIGGGLPAAAYGGPVELMRHLAPLGPVYQAGTLSGNSLAMAAGIATLDELARPGAFARLEATSQALARIVREAAAEAEVPVTAAAIGGMWGFFLGADPVRDLAGARRADAASYARLFHALLAEGVHLPPSALEACFVTLAHDAAVLDRSRNAFRRAFTALALGTAPEMTHTARED